MFKGTITRKIRHYFEVNEDESTTYQYLWDAVTNSAQAEIYNNFL